MLYRFLYQFVLDPSLPYRQERRVDFVKYCLSGVLASYYKYPVLESTGEWEIRERWGKTILTSKLDNPESLEKRYMYEFKKSYRLVGYNLFNKELRRRLGYNPLIKGTPKKLLEALESLGKDDPYILRLMEYVGWR